MFPSSAEIVNIDFTKTMIKSWNPIPAVLDTAFGWHSVMLPSFSLILTPFVFTAFTMAVFTSTTVTSLLRDRYPLKRDPMAPEPKTVIFKLLSLPAETLLQIFLQPLSTFTATVLHGFSRNASPFLKIFPKYYVELRSTSSEPMLIL